MSPSLVGTILLGDSPVALASLAILGGDSVMMAQTHQVEYDPIPLSM